MIELLSIIITLFICASPFIALIWIIKTIGNWMVKVGKKQKQKKMETKENNDWYLNPETGLWTNRKNQEETARRKKTEESSYRFKGKEIQQDQKEPRQYHFHHTNTTATEPEMVADPTDIPNEDWKTADAEAAGTTYRFKKNSIMPEQIMPSDIPQEEKQTTKTEPAQEKYQPYTQSRPEQADRYVYPHQYQLPGYKAKYLLTPNEWHEHKKLRQYAADKGLFVCPKVRLLDLVTPFGNGKEYMTRFHKVQAKHVDFVLVDDSMHIKAIVELDDNSHNTKERQERDEFIDSVLSSVGYTVIHTRSITRDTLRGI